MREKELRLALVCYGGISLAVYMHGVTKEIWHAVRASRAHLDGDVALEGSVGCYRALLQEIETITGVRLRVLADILAGASAGGINAVFLAQAIATGQSLDPLTDMWLENADIERLLADDARPSSRFSKFWASPLAWAAAPESRKDEDAADREARGEVTRKLSTFVRSRWFSPPFGGARFTGMLLDAFDAMAEAPASPPLLPPYQPLDLMVTVTDFTGYPQRLKLHSPQEVLETEHRLTLSFRALASAGESLGDAAGLVFAARATASFPGAFPPFSVRELDKVLASRDRKWNERDAFLSSQLPRQSAIDRAEDTALIDGSVLANAPFRQVIGALKSRPARREIDRRVVYLDPSPNMKTVSLSGRRSSERTRVPGFFSTILGALSDIPREQPIHDNIETIGAMSQRIVRMRAIIEAMRPEVEERVEKLFGRAFFLDRPTPARLRDWRMRAQRRAIADAGFAFPVYAHLKLAAVVEELAQRLNAADRREGERSLEEERAAIWAAATALGLDHIDRGEAKSARDPSTLFFRRHDIGFRVRRLRLLARRLQEIVEVPGHVEAASVTIMRNVIYDGLAGYFDRLGKSFYSAAVMPDPGAPTEDKLDALATAADLMRFDGEVDEALATALALLPRKERRAMLMAYLGFPFYDIATLPLLQGEGLDEFDPIKIDRISPNDATAIRAGGTEATLKGIGYNRFGAFFSRAYRENDYLWGRLHGAERLIDIIASAMPAGHELPAGTIATLQRKAFQAILDEESPRLDHVGDLIEELRGEIGPEA